MLTKEQAVTLPVGAVLFNTSKIGKDKRPVRVRVNGRCQTWKKVPDRWSLPVKYGLHNCFYVTPDSAEHWTVDEQEAQAKCAARRSATFYLQQEEQV
jgi:hypothetical protein